MQAVVLPRRWLRIFWGLLLCHMVCKTIKGGCCNRGAVGREEQVTRPRLGDGLVQNVYGSGWRVRGFPRGTVGLSAGSGSLYQVPGMGREGVPNSCPKTGLDWLGNSGGANVDSVFDATLHGHDAVFKSRVVDWSTCYVLFKKLSTMVAACRVVFVPFKAGYIVSHACEVGIHRADLDCALCVCFPLVLLLSHSCTEK